jgi:hypothetical protein
MIDSLAATGIIVASFCAPVMGMNQHCAPAAPHIRAHRQARRNRHIRGFVLRASHA